MGEVWEATLAGEAGFSRRVAIKRMFPERESDAAFARMFLDEARIVSQLHHANIVAVLDFGIAHGVPLQALELIDGTDCRQVRRRAVAAGQAFAVELGL